MKYRIEVHAAEGGEDAKLLVSDQAGIYIAFATRHGARALVRESKGWLVLEIEGKSPALARLLEESGGHRWQRIPPTERKGRVHTSTVTVAVFQESNPGTAPHALSVSLPDSEVEIRTTRDTGPGGQHRNKVESCVVMTHKPTGIQAKASSRCQHANRREARAMLETRVAEHYRHQANQEHAADKRAQLGTGQRGDKTRTYRCQDDVVIDHASGTKSRLRDILKGMLP